MDELAILHVTSHLHVASLRRGIQVWKTLQADKWVSAFPKNLLSPFSEQKKVGSSRLL
jgi:hypothetical protein